MPKAFGEIEKKTIHTQLLQQGRKQFALYGLRKTTVEELALAAGISKGAFYLFYDSKEALFMDVVERAEVEFRQEVLAIVDVAEGSPYDRLFAVLHKAFTLWKSIPILQLFTSGDYEVLARKVPAATLEAHLHSDQSFIHELIAHCAKAGIHIQAQPEQVDGLLHTLFFASLHEHDFGPNTLTNSIELLLRLTTAYCLGEIALQPTLLAGNA